MDKPVWSTSDNSTEVSEYVSDAAATVVLPTTSKNPARPAVSAEILTTVAIVIYSVGAIANAGVLAVLIRARRHFGSAVHTLIANQSAMDLCVCVFSIVGFIVMFTHGYKYNGNNKILDGTICMLFEADTLGGYPALRREYIDNVYFTT